MRTRNRGVTSFAIVAIAAPWMTAACAVGQSAQPQSPPPAAPPTTRPLSPAVLPGDGLAQHPFLYAGEYDTRHPEAQSMFLVSGGKIVWQYSIPMKAERGGIQEFDDATLLPNGNIIFSRMSGAGIVAPDKTLVWKYRAPVGTEVHSAQYIGNDRVLIMRNGTPAQAMIINIATNQVEKVIPIPTTVKATHGQFRHIRMTPTGTILVGHMGEGKVAEYDQDGNVVWSVKALNAWSATRLDNGNTLITGDARAYVREVNPSGQTVWEFNQSDAPEYKLYNIQGAERLANGNTVFCNWCPNGLKKTSLWPQTVQVLEVTPDKKVVWALRSWESPADLGTATSIQLLDEPGAPAMHLPAQ
jgi:Mala s 1-like protein